MNKVSPEPAGQSPSGPDSAQDNLAGGETQDCRKGREKWLFSYPWLLYIGPFLVFMVVGSFEPKPPVEGQEAANWTLPYSYYPLIYCLKIALAVVVMVYLWPGYREFPWRLSPWSVVVGVLGAVAWVAICKLRLEARYLGPLGLGWFVDLGQRSAFNPLVELARHPVWKYVFLGVRLFGLAVVVAVMEEFFLRGFLMRYFMRDHWWEVPFGDVNRTALVVGTLVPVMMHPAEILAAAVWFSSVTWLMLKTRNIWDCVVAHGFTNLLLGLYVLYSGDWWLM